MCEGISRRPGKSVLIILILSSFRQGACVNRRDYCGWQPIHEASNHGHKGTSVFDLQTGRLVSPTGQYRNPCAPELKIDQLSLLPETLLVGGGITTVQVCPDCGLLRSARMGDHRGSPENGNLVVQNFCGQDRRRAKPQSVINFDWWRDTLSRAFRHDWHWRHWASLILTACSYPDQNYSWGLK